ncbi:MAG TPA: hypothetical protein VGI17_08100 [Solirubrobacterales bacterium]|jgi:hypothetical protein
MDHSKRNRTPAELEGIEAALRAERHEATPLELDRIKLQAIRQAERSRPSPYASKKGTFMKSRLALTLLLVAGFMLSTTGATLAISGSSGSGNAASTQYVSPGGGGGNHPEHEVKGVNNEGGKENCKSGGGNGGGGNGAGGNGCKHANTLQPTSEVEVAPAATEQEAVVSSGSSLPFTGFLAIPLLVIGLGLIVVGAVIRLKSRNEPAA